MTKLEELYKNVQKMNQKKHFGWKRQIKEQECQMQCETQEKDTCNQNLQEKENLQAKQFVLQSALKELQEELLQARTEMEKRHNEVMQLQVKKEILTISHNIAKEQVSKLVQILISDEDERKVRIEEWCATLILSLVPRLFPCVDERKVGSLVKFIT